MKSTRGFLNFVRNAVVLAAASVMASCSSLPLVSSTEQPFGLAVVKGGANSQSSFGGNSDSVDVESGKKVAYDRELLPVFVKDPIIADSALDDIDNYDSVLFAELTRRSTIEALAGFGRFATVQSPDQAMLIVEPRIISVIPWKDTVTKEDGFKVSDEIKGRHITSDGKVGVRREGIDVSMSLSFSRLDGATIANERATGRLSSSQGDVLRRSHASSEDLSGSSSSFQKLDQAAVDSARLSEVVNDTVRGIMVVMLKQFDERWWDSQRDKDSGIKRFNRTQLAVFGEEMTE